MTGSRLAKSVGVYLNGQYIHSVRAASTLWTTASCCCSTPITGRSTSSCQLAGARVGVDRHL